MDNYYCTANKNVYKFFYSAKKGNNATIILVYYVYILNKAFFIPYSCTKMFHLLKAIFEKSKQHNQSCLTSALNLVPRMAARAAEYSNSRELAVALNVYNILAKPMRFPLGPEDGLLLIPRPFVLPSPTHLPTPPPPSFFLDSHTQFKARGLQ